MKRVYRCLVVFAGWALSSLLIQAQSSASVDVIADFLADFKSATISKPVAEVSLNKSTCGGVTRPTLYQHPVGPNDPASTVSYTVELPKASTEQRLFLVTSIGLSDGVQWQSGKADGVRFTVRVNDQTILERTLSESQWIPYCIDLENFQNRKAKIDFITHPLQDTSYDWACWGEPRILLFSGSLPLQGNTLPLNSGTLALLHNQEQPLSLKLTCSDTNQVQSWTYTPEKEATASLRWDILDFNFSDVQHVQMQVEPTEALRSTLLGYYPFDIRLETFTPSSALITPGANVPLRYKVTNKGHGKLSSGVAQVMAFDAEKNVIGASPIPELEPGNSWNGDIPWIAPTKPGVSFVSAQLSVSDPRGGLNSNASQLGVQNEASFQTRTTAFEVVPHSNLSPLTELPNTTRTATKTQGSFWLDNGKMRAIFSRSGEGINYATLYSRKGESWEEVAVWKPLIRVNLNTPQGPIVWEPTFTQGVRGRNADSSERYTNSWQFFSTPRDPLNNQWNIGLNVTMDPNSSELSIHYTWSTEGNPMVHSLLGPNIYVGDGSFGSSKISGLFPGLEYLHGAEASSSVRDFAPEIADRRSPSSNKITIPFMAISWGETNQAAVLNPERFFCPDSTKDYWTAGDQAQKTIGLYWDISQKWDGTTSMPTPRFSSPNQDEGMNNHRLALFLPSIGDYMMENQDYSYTWQMEARKVYNLSSELAITDGPILTAVRHHLEKNNGLPAVSPWARTPAQERALCRTGFDTVWDGTNKWSHCVDWPYSIAPGFAALLQADLLSDPALAKEALTQEGKTEGSLRDLKIRERIEPTAKAALASDPTGGSLASENNCHIMLWEFPFQYGYLEAALDRVDQQMKSLIASQQPDGSWLFNPTGTQQKTLGQAQDATMGTTAVGAMKLMRHARITGDKNSLQAGLKALGFINRFAVPRGGQVWECPLYQPDILPVAHVLEASVDAWRVTGNASYLTEAVGWAETALPFIYLWSLPDKPMMLGATIPVFGSTFYTHTWLAVPVQWNGLVYSYRLQHLIQALETLSLTQETLPTGVLGFDLDDWKTIVGHIFSSATHQQWPEGKLIGTYPDSISDFEKRNGAHINPEDILVNQLALEGADPDIRTVVLDQTTLCGVSTAAEILEAQQEGKGYRMKLRYPAPYGIHAVVNALPQPPTEVIVDGTPLPRSETALQQEAGWHYQATKERLFLNLPNPEGTVTIQVH